MTMQPTACRVDQTEHGVGNPRANCWQAALASLFGIPLEEAIDATDPALTPAWFEHSVVWARSRGYELEAIDEPPATGTAIVVGTTDRSSDKHAVIYLGGELWHDPHPSRAGLVEVRFAVIARPHD